MDRSRRGGGGRRSDFKTVAEGGMRLGRNEAKDVNDSGRYTDTQSGWKEVGIFIQTAACICNEDISGGWSPLRSQVS